MDKESCVEVQQNIASCVTLAGKSYKSGLVGVHGLLRGTGKKKHSKFEEC